MTDTVSLAIVGAGLMGRQHADAVARCDAARIACVVDPAPLGKELAGQYNVPHYGGIADMAAAERPDGAILSTPNQLHLDHGLACAQAGLPALIEKPIAPDVASATKLVEAFEAKGLPLLVGHHRRHSDRIRAAYKSLSDGAIGRIVAVNALFWLYKPDNYFEHKWRTQPGAGPVYLNLIHDIDLLRHLCGEIVSVTAEESNAVRGHDVEDSAAMLLRFANGALGTVSVSDTIAAPWSWEFTAEENPAYHPSKQSCYFIGGTHGSMELPQPAIWRHPEERGWWEPIGRETLPFSGAETLIQQIGNLAGVIAGREDPVVSGREGLKSLKVIEAIKNSAANGKTVHLDD